jgi:hypothetical protein
VLELRYRAVLRGLGGLTAWGRPPRLLSEARTLGLAGAVVGDALGTHRFFIIGAGACRRACAAQRRGQRYQQGAACDAMHVTQLLEQVKQGSRPV